MKKAKTAAWWVAAFLFFSCAMASFPSFGFLLFLLGIAVTAPLPVLLDFWDGKGLRGAPKVALAVALLIVGTLFIPDSLKGRGAEKESDAAAVVEEAQPAAESVAEETPTEPAPEPEPEPVSEPTPEPAEETPEPIEEKKPLVGKDIAEAGIIFGGSVRNDVTGRWRFARTSANVQMQEYAVSYYNEYFKSDDEIHFVVNFANNTTSEITYLLGQLEVDVYSRVDGEEHDAKMLPAGELLARYWVNMETGEIEKI